MGHRPFSKPVFLKLHRTGYFQARNAWEAYEYLDLHWPSTRTAHYRQAKAVCQSAIDGAVDAETARSAVIDAAQRAGLLATNWEVEGSPTHTSYVVGNAFWPSSATFEADVAVRIGLPTVCGGRAFRPAIRWRRCLMYVGPSFSSGDLWS